MSTQDRKPFIVWLFMVAVFFIIALLTSCGKKTLSTKTESTTKLDSLHTVIRDLTERNREINDKLQFQVPVLKSSRPDCDSICNAEMDAVLSKLNWLKQSGDNSYKLLYDKYTRLLTFQATIGETTNTSKSEETYQLRTINTKKETVTKVPVPFTPWYWKYPGYLGYAALLYIAFRLIKKYYTSWLPKKLST